MATNYFIALFQFENLFFTKGFIELLLLNNIQTKQNTFPIDSEYINHNRLCFSPSTKVRIKKLQEKYLFWFLQSRKEAENPLFLFWKYAGPNCIHFSWTVSLIDSHNAGSLFISNSVNIFYLYDIK